LQLQTCETNGVIERYFWSGPAGKNLGHYAHDVAWLEITQ
jgi:hypothetical protein